MVEKPSKNEEEYYDLISGDWHGVRVDQCTNCHGLWFGRAEAARMVHEEHGIVRRVFAAVMRGVSGNPRIDR